MIDSTKPKFVIIVVKLMWKNDEKISHLDGIDWNNIDIHSFQNVPEILFDCNNN